MIVSLFAGPGGTDEGARLVGVPDQIYGYDIDPDACATATAAGHNRTRASVVDLDPADFPAATGAIVTPPCPPFSRAGLGRGHRDFPAIRESLALLGDHFAGRVGERAYRATLRDLADERSALVVETLRFAFALPRARWLVAEQVPGAAGIWREIGAELAACADWEFIAVMSVASEDLGVTARRTRSFLVATRDYTPDLTGLPMRDLWVTGRFIAPADRPVTPTTLFRPPTMAQVLGWPTGERVNTRGNRKTPGGNVFSADGLSWCITEKTRSWRRVSDGRALTEHEAGLLMGFPADYPWQGSRTRRFLQVADAVSPVVAAAVLGAVLGLDWPKAVRTYLARIYPAPSAAPTYTQPALFDSLEGIAS